jgi:hypothetical protein
MSAGGWSVRTLAQPSLHQPAIRSRHRPARRGVIRRVLVLPVSESVPVDAAECGYDRWECPRCGDDLGDCGDPASVRPAQRCVCGAVVVEVWCT